MDWQKAVNWVAGYVLRWTVGALVFGALLEYFLSLSHPGYRIEVPVLMTTLIFTLSLSGGIMALYLSWLIQRYSPNSL
jgi:hypothetical protein